MIRFFFCLNQVSYIVASKAAAKLPGFNMLVVMPNRVHVDPHSPVRSIKYQSLVAALVLALSMITKRVEVSLPHTKAAGRLTRCMSKHSKNLTYLDDGMDTFRNQPKNIELHLLRADSKYYTFDHGIDLPKWLANVQIVPVCPVGNLANDPKSKLNLDGYDALIIESPGVDISSDFSKFGKVFYLTHPNHNKSRGLKFGGDSASGADFSVERTLLEFEGIVIVGESMALVFALLCLPSCSKIRVYLDRSQYENLSSLHLRMESCGYVAVGH